MLICVCRAFSSELLIECGLGGGGNDGPATLALNHRVLIFAQQKTTLDLIEQLVFRPHLPHLSYLRLDGGVEPVARYPIVHRFNSDPTIDVLLLTTHVGGLGLNLTSADTVIFMDPDWNPMRDLQAMDRAHRLGQKRVVTVYRLLLKDSLEERIMGLQQWKLLVANTVVTQQNASLATMRTEGVLGLFEDSLAGDGKRGPRRTDANTAESVSESWLRRKHPALGPEAASVDSDDDHEAEYAREFSLHPTEHK